MPKAPILIIDTEPVLPKYLADHFRAQGFKIIVVSKALEAIMVFNQNPEIRVILSDLKLEDMTWQELWQTIKDPLTDRGGSLFWMTGNPNSGLVKEAQNDFPVIVKPEVYMDFPELFSDFISLEIL